MLAICRTCLREVKDKHFINLDSGDAANIKVKLATCIPELELVLVKNAVICKSCCETLHLAYNFKKQSLATEKCVRRYMHERNINSVSLTEVFKNAKETLQIPPVKWPKTANCDITKKLNDLLDEVVHDEQQCDTTKTEDEKGNIIETQEDAMDCLIQDAIVKEEYVISGEDFHYDEESSTIDSQSNFQVNTICGSKDHYQVKREVVEQEIVPVEVANSKNNRMYIKITSALQNIQDSTATSSFPYNESFVIKHHFSTNEKQSEVDNEKLFPCDFCSFKTARIRDLVEHRKTHKGLKPYKCDKCQKSFLQHHKFQIHVLSHKHINQKPYECHLCEYRTGKEIFLRSHVIKMHRI